MLSTKPDDLKLIPRTHMLERGNQFPLVVLLPSYMHTSPIPTHLLLDMEILMIVTNSIYLGLLIEYILNLLIPKITKYARYVVSFDLFMP